jgi:hypothetical protein
LGDARGIDVSDDSYPRPHRAMKLSRRSFLLGTERVSGLGLRYIDNENVLVMPENEGILERILWLAYQHLTSYSAINPIFRFRLLLMQAVMLVQCSRKRVNPDRNLANRRG